ncbi:hypothetical protein R3P38DRAFT_2878976 [Favolaschia claudopus]|uniref:Uncharacterized protein n=1 Tax=Favolaschia claudopus TaxID=2862362 RepID=A0AAW0CZ73_9AGAR
MLCHLHRGRCRSNTRAWFSSLASKSSASLTTLYRFFGLCLPLTVKSQNSFPDRTYIYLLKYLPSPSTNQRLIRDSWLHRRACVAISGREGSSHIRAAVYGRGSLPLTPTHLYPPPHSNHLPAHHQKTNCLRLLQPQAGTRDPLLHAAHYREQYQERGLKLIDLIHGACNSQKGEALARPTRGQSTTGMWRARQGYELGEQDRRSWVQGKITSRLEWN